MVTVVVTAIVVLVVDVEGHFHIRVELKRSVVLGKMQTTFNHCHRNIIFFSFDFSYTCSCLLLMFLCTLQQNVYDAWALRKLYA